MKKIALLLFIVSLTLFSCKETTGFIDIYQLDYRIDNSSSPYKVYFYLDADYYGPDEALTATWDFDDGTTSNDIMPVHAFYEDRVYNVKLTLVNYQTVVNKTITIDLRTPHTPVARFTWYALDGNDDMIAPAEVQFINLSRFADTYMWDFGDQRGSIDADPTHLYENPDYYYVTLKVVSGKDTVANTQEIDVNQMR